MGYKLKRILIYPDGVTEKQVYPAGWKPGANTLFYLPLVENANDISGNNRNATTSNVTFSSDGALCQSSGNILTDTFTMGNVYTINTWMKAPDGFTGSKWITIHSRWTSSNRYVQFYVNSSTLYANLGNGSSDSGSRISASFSMGTSWHNVVLTRNGGSLIIYVDGQKLVEGNPGYTLDPGYFYIGNNPSDGSFYTMTSCFKDYIMENKVRTADEIAGYYNLTKSNYGL